MSESPISLRDETGIERFRGTQSPGGGSQPLTSSYDSPAPVTIADGFPGVLTLELQSGDPLLDLTDPANPLIVAAGLYAATAIIFSTAPLTPGGYALLTVIDQTNGGQVITDSLHPEVGVGACVVFPATANDVLNVQVNNNDGAASRDYYVSELFLVKLA